jgi:S1-C subfamily serine protease
LQIRTFGIGIDCSHAADTSACGVDFVAANSMAAKQGIQVGDQITSFEGVRMNDAVGK